MKSIYFENKHKVTNSVIIILFLCAQKITEDLKIAFLTLFGNELFIGTKTVNYSNDSLQQHLTELRTKTGTAPSFHPLKAY